MKRNLFNYILKQWMNSLIVYFIVNKFNFPSTFNLILISIKKNYTFGINLFFKVTDEKIK